jgi:hypothetical protein
MEILNKQRLLRPSSPHFTIYQPQLTWLGSIFNRVTGVALSTCTSLYFFHRSMLPPSSSVVRILTRLPRRTRNLRQCSRRRVCSWTSRCCKVHWKGASRPTVYFPFAQRVETFGLGYGQMFVVSLSLLKL